MTPGEAVVGWLLFASTMTVARCTARYIGICHTQPERCLYIGGTESAARFDDKLSHDRGTNSMIVGQMTFPQGGCLTAADARSLVDRMRVQRVIVAPETVGATEVLHIVRTFEVTGVHVSIVPALYQVLGSSVTVDSVDGSAVFGLKSFRLTRSSFFVKRLFDSIGACLILLVGAPVMAAIALAIRFDSAGPVLFRQRRIGRDGREFIVFKFRTMVANAEVLKVNLEARNEAADGFFKIREDPRITRVGRLLRRSSLDELPQLLNVLRGEMSLVGPRPLIPEEDARVEGWHRRRLELMPGMTGPWQVLGSSRVPLREMVALDYLYVAHWTLWTDIKLMLRTVPHVLASRSQ
jgi:exopolysaccharide biosynthesis polyprenyl glycosylphosphotransferase